LVQKNFWPKKKLVQKNFVPKFFWSKQNFWLKHIFGPKQFLTKISFGPKKFVVRKSFGPKIVLVQTALGGSDLVSQHCSRPLLSLEIAAGSKVYYLEPIPGWVRSARVGSARLTSDNNAISVRLQLQFPTGTELGKKQYH